jgi:hypothetical protein
MPPNLLAISVTHNAVSKLNSAHDSRRMRWAGHVASTGESSGAHRILVRNPDGKTPFGRPRRRWEDNMETNLQEVQWGLDWIDLAQDRDRFRACVNAVMNPRFP